MEENRRWRWGVNRWLVLLFIILSVITSGIVAPMLPHIQLPAENLTSSPLFTLPVIGEFYLTNTLVATLITDLVLLLIGYGVYRTVKTGDLIPKGLTGAIEALLEIIYNLTETTAGRWTRAIFPFFATITLLVLIANWMELIPFVDSVGIFNPEHIASVEGCTINTLISIPHVVAVSGNDECSRAIIPYVRVVSTDLNFTVGLALIAVIMTQVIGLRAQGGAYLTKFFNVKTIFSRPIFGVIDFGVGLLELVSDVSKILSFSFRLFGNLFAGSVLLFVIGSLVPVFAQTMVLMLEFFVGLIQAVIFGLLTMTFMAQATQGHGAHE